MTQPALLAVAHGSINPAAAEVTRDLAEQVRRLAPVLDVHVAFLGHAEPSLPTELDATGAGAVIVPLLLSSGYHLSADITGAASSAGARVAAPLGPDQLLVTALTGRLTEAGVPQGTPVVLAAAGSADPASAAAVREQAELLADALGAPVVAAFASCGTPAVSQAVAELRARTGHLVAVASYLLAPGQFQDQLAASGADWVTEPLGAHPALAGLVIERYRVARAAKSSAVAAAH
jgi:sirohydrochlorin ferrochelatase